MTLLEIDVEIPDLAEIEVETPDVEVTPSSGETVLLVAVPGSPGAAGPPGDGAQIFGEPPTGAINGINTVFTTADTFFTGCTEVFLNGLRETHYTETGSSEITFDDPPLAGDDIRVNYIVEG